MFSKSYKKLLPRWHRSGSSPLCRGSGNPVNHHCEGRDFADTALILHLLRDLGWFGAAMNLYAGA